MQNPRTYTDLGPPIFADVVAPGVRAEVEDLATWRRRWRKGGNILEACAIALGVLSAIFAFAAGFFNVLALSFVAGLLMSVSTGLTTYSKYANHESSERTATLNRLLLLVGISPEPDLVVDDTAPPAAAPPTAAPPTVVPPATPPAPPATPPAPPAADPGGKQDAALLAALAATPVDTRAPVAVNTQ